MRQSRLLRTSPTTLVLVMRTWPSSRNKLAVIGHRSAIRLILSVVRRQIPIPAAMRCSFYILARPLLLNHLASTAARLVAMGGGDFSPDPLEKQASVHGSDSEMGQIQERRHANPKARRIRLRVTTPNPRIVLRLI